MKDWSIQPGNFLNSLNVARAETVFLNEHEL